MIYRWFKDDLKESLDEGRDNSRSHFVLAVLCPDQPRCHHPPGYFKVVIDVKNMFQLYRHHDYNLYSFLARLPLHIFWRNMMMPGINWDRAFSSSNRVEGDLSRISCHHHHHHHSHHNHHHHHHHLHHQHHLLQLKQSGRRPEQKSLSSSHFFFFPLTINITLISTFLPPTDDWHHSHIRNHSHLHHSSSTHWRLKSLSHQKSLSVAHFFFHSLTGD